MLTFGILLFSTMIDLASPMAVVCHDAGAANLILAWLQEWPEIDFRAVMRGPAEKLWLSSRLALDKPLYVSLDDALAGAAVLLSGTGWASELEHESRLRAKMKEIFVIAVIDHWANYRARFVRRQTEVLPDEIWVTDRYAYDEAIGIFKNIIIRQLPNNYLMNCLQGIGPVTSDMGDSILYLSEPIRNEWGKGLPGEFQALDFFLQFGAIAGIPADAAIRLRLHPAEDYEKYSAFLGRYPGRIALDNSASLAEAINKSIWVVGCQTFALVVALAAGRKVVCSMPPWAPPCCLPHDGIIHLKEWV